MDRVEDPAADDDRGADADDAREVAGEAGVGDVADSVVGEGRVGGGVLLDLPVEALVGGDLFQAVGAGGGVEGDDAGEEEGRAETGGEDAARGAGGGGRRGGGSGGVDQLPVDPQLERRGEAAAPYTRSGRTAMTAPTVRAVIAASPRPMRTCTPTIAVSTLPIGMSVVPPMA